ncbi:mitochondrial ribosomal protein L52 [Ptiloglossa arizonensis]|uniref:mitochondrial ribosomal protein L52 n=1 Tax=Ptiloglossa arizonensis TaxID=3350558 RepID=UPI003FA001F3
MLSTRIILRTTCCTNLVTTVNEYHTSSVTFLNQQWRRTKGLVKNPNSYGPLVNLPDYSFKDNRPVPYGSKQFQRIKKHQEFGKRILKLVGEIDYAVEKHAKLLKQKEETKQQILDGKLKPKGQLLLMNK